MPESVVVRSAGLRRTGWTSVSIFRSLDSLAHAYEIGMTDRPQTNGAARQPIAIEDFQYLAANARVDIELSNTHLLRGDIDNYLPAYDARSSTIFWSGRNLAGDLIDCQPGFSATESKQFKNQSLLTIAQSLLKPFNLSVSVAEGVDIGAPLTVSIDPGEAVAEFIERLARYRAVLVTSDGVGNLEFTRAGLQRASVELVYGKNILSASGSFSVRDMYSSYTVVSQINDADGNSGAVAASRQRGVASESLLGKRYRPRVIVSDQAANSAECKKLAQWEQRTRSARGRAGVYTVNGWREDPTNPASPVWEPGKLIRVRDPKLQIDGDRLITAVQLVQEDSLQQAELSVAPLEGYDLLVEPMDADNNVRSTLLANAVASA